MREPVVHDNVAFHGVAELRRVEDHPGLRLQRVPEAVRLKLNAKAARRMLAPDGAEIRFVSAADVVEVTLSSAESQIEVIAFWGGFQGLQRCRVGPEPATLRFEYPQRVRQLRPDAARGHAFPRHVWRLGIRGTDKHAIAHFHAIRGEGLRPPRADELPERTCLAYGSSITDGFGATAWHLAFVAQMARRLKADAINLGSAGSAWCEPELADYMAARTDWDFATLCLALNMIGGAFSVDEFHERARYMVHAMAAADERRPVLCITPVPYFGDLCADVEGPHGRGLSEPYRDALRRIVSDCPHPNVHMVEGSDLLRDIDGYSIDLAHPGDAGMVQIGQMLAARLERILDDAPRAAAGGAARAGAEPIRIRAARQLPASGLAAERIRLGATGDYKPMLVQLADGSLLLTAFRGRDLDEFTPEGRRCMHEDVLFFRSGDGGRTWEGPQISSTVLPREPYLSVLRDGTLLLTIHLHGRDHRNLDRVPQSRIYRSEDGGWTWAGRHLVPDAYPPGIWIHSSRNALELADGSLILGISGAGDAPDLIYRSNDGGRTWTHHETVVADKPKGYPFPFWAETVFWQCPGGRLLALARVSDKDWPIPGQAPPSDAHGDQSERLVVLTSDDEGRSWRYEQDLGGYGVMYPALLRLADGRLLLTYTTRSMDVPLGVRAAVGRETRDTIAFDFDHDALIIDGKTPEGQTSGGGFGNTIQLADGTLVTPYSYRMADRPEAAGTESTTVEVARWSLPALGTRP